MAVNQSLTVTEVADSVNTADNTSKVRILWKSTQTGESWNGYERTAYYYVSINGSAETRYSVTYTLPPELTVTIVDVTIEVPHKDDGTGSVKVRTWMNTDISAGIVEKSQYINLTTIARASTIDLLSCSTSYFTGTLTYKYTPKSLNYWNKCNISLNLNGEYTAVKSIELGNKSASQKTATVTLSEDELSIIYNKLPKATKGTLRFTFRTYSDGNYSNQIGDAGYKEITLSIPNTSATKPSISMTLSAVNTLEGDFSKLYIQGYTKVRATFTGSGKYGATVSSYRLTVQDDVDSTSPYESGYLTTTGTIAVTGRATDSRGYYNESKQNISVIPYGKPTIIPASGESDVICARCDENGNYSDSGEYLKIKAKRSYSKVISSGTQKNFCSIRYRYKVDGGSYSSWTTILSSDSLSSDEIETGALLNGALSVQHSYLVQVQAIDDLGENTYVTITVPTDRVYMHKAGSIRSLGIGEYAEEENTLSVADDIRVRMKGGMLPIEIPEFTDFDTLTKPNFYYGRYTYTPNYLNCPIKVQATFSLEVIAMGRDGQLLQRIVRCSDEATVYERQYFSHEWHEWEYVNPPMVEWEEYRTKERYLGKPVYTKLINFGTLPNAAYKLVEHGATVSQVIRCVGQMSDGNNLPFHFSDTNWVEIYAGPEYIVILTSNDKTNRSAYAQMWYVK
jgi:hypothetical protein